MENYKSTLKDLLGNRLDRVNIIYNLAKLRVEYNDEAPFVILKYQLQLEVLKEIYKELGENQNIYYSTLRKETEEYLEYHNLKSKKTGFHCCLVGCLFKSKKHRDYIRHLKQFHARESNLTCQFGLSCPRTFSSLEILLEHIKVAHCSETIMRKDMGRKLPPMPIEIPCRCVMMRCLGKQFSSIRALMLHMRTFHASETVQCIFNGCDKKFNKSATFRSHFYEKHLKLNMCVLKDVHKLDNPVGGSDIIVNHDIIPEQDEAQVYEAEVFPGDYEDIDSEDEVVGGDDVDENFLMSYCDFLNRMANFHFIPHSTIKIIGEEYLKNYTKSNEAKIKMLKKSLSKVPGITENEIHRVLDDFQSEDVFLEAQRKLDSEYKRVQFLKDNFVYVEPEEIVLNPRQVKESQAPKAVVHYVSVIETVKNLVEDASFNEMIEKESESIHTEKKIRDVKDGQLYKNQSFFKENPGAFTMMLYSDAIELVNPLGAGRGRHKVIQIFFSICEIPKRQRSRIDRIQLVAVFKEKLIKRFGFKKIYSKLVEDLKVLEAGVTVTKPVQRIIKCGLLIHPADNLEANGVGGFSQCFSSKDICRKDYAV